MGKDFSLKKIVIVISLCFSIVFGLNTIKQLIIMNEIKEESIVKSRELENLKESNSRLSTELDEALIDNDYIEKLARERLGLIKEGEKIVIPSKKQ